MTKLLTAATQADHSQYQQEGCVLLRGVLPDDLLDDCQRVLERWVDDRAQAWRDEGLLTDLHEDLPFEQRFNVVWRDAGKPQYSRSPRAPIARLSPETMYDILRHPTLLDIAEVLLDTNELISHGVWNTRPKCLDARHTDTPLHQDAQYYRKEAYTGIMSVWFPLHRVDEQRSCLEVSPGFESDRIFNADESSGTGFIGISPADAKGLPRVPMPMDRGDLLCFNALTPHAAMPNTSGLMRWSMDLRFVPTATAHPNALKQGFIARSADPASLTTFEDWHKMWDDPKA